MTRIAPTLTLLAVAALGGGMFVANAMNNPGAPAPASPTPAPAAATLAPAAPSAPAGATVISLADIPVVGAKPDTASPTGGSSGGGATGSGSTALEAGQPEQPRQPIVVSLADIPVVGGTGAGASPAPAGSPGRTEISLSDLPVVQPAGTGRAPGTDSAAAPTVFAGRTADRTKTVAIAVRGDRAEAYVCQRGKLEVWLSGTATGGTLSLKSASGRSTLTGTVTANETSGTVTIDGTATDFTATGTDVAGAAASGRDDVAKVVAQLGGAG